MSKDTKPTTDEKRLWIGNLDSRVTEYGYQLLKLAQKYGQIEKFDIIFHKTGSLVGQPRGYAFVTYSKPEEAIRAKRLNNMLLGSKHIVVTWAHSMPTEIQEEPKKSDVHIPALSISKSDNSGTDREFQIQAIEAKLKLMDSQSSKELEINKSVTQERSIVAMYQHNQNKPNMTGNSSNCNKMNRRYDNRSKGRPPRPYDKYKRK